MLDVPLALILQGPSRCLENTLKVMRRQSAVFHGKKKNKKNSKIKTKNEVAKCLHAAREKHTKPTSSHHVAGSPLNNFVLIADGQ